MAKPKLKWEVRSLRTGTLIAAFILQVDAKNYTKLLYDREGPNGAGYEVVEND